ncbi:MAG TPA: Rid family detoxifying hydrolase [Streptosporangiaceae bacterium]
MKDDGTPELGRMISISPVSTTTAARPGGPYSQAVAAADFVFVSGQRPVDPATGAIPESFARQANAVLTNLRHVLAAAGSSPDQVVKVTVYLADLRFFDEFNAVYQQYFSPPYPSRTTVGSQLRDILVEVDAIATRQPPGEAES